MMRRKLCMSAGLMVVLLSGAMASPAMSDPVLAPHRAVYDLHLGAVKGRSSVDAVQGKLVVEFTGNRCEGYSSQFRQITEIGTSDGRQVTTDMRSTFWESANGNSLRFRSESQTDKVQDSLIEGQAERQADGAVAVSLLKPEAEKFSAGHVVFPTDQLKKIIEAAQSGQSTVNLRVYDGSTSGRIIYNTLTVIGRRIPPQDQVVEKAADRQELKAMFRWPVTISYFEVSSDREKGRGGEQTPAYVLSFDLYENGVSRNLSLDYGEFAFRGDMQELEFMPVRACP